MVDLQENDAIGERFDEHSICLPGKHLSISYSRGDHA